MAKREPKSRHTTTIEIVARPGETKGWIEAGTGSLIYYRPSAKRPTLQLTYLQLIALFEKELEYIDINEKKFKLTRSHKEGDFRFSVYDHEHELANDWSDNLLFESVSSIKNLDPRTIDLGDYQFDESMANGRKQKRYTWFAHVSIQAVLWILHRYIEKFLVSKKSKTHADEDIQVSKQEMSEILIGFYKRINC